MRSRCCTVRTVHSRVLMRSRCCTVRTVHTRVLMRSRCCTVRTVNKWSHRTLVVLFTVHSTSSHRDSCLCLQNSKQRDLIELLTCLWTVNNVLWSHRTLEMSATFKNVISWDHLLSVRRHTRVLWDHVVYCSNRHSRVLWDHVVYCSQTYKSSHEITCLLFTVHSRVLMRSLVYCSNRHSRVLWDHVVYCSQTYKSSHEITLFTVSQTVKSSMRSRCLLWTVNNVIS